MLSQRLGFYAHIGGLGLVSGSQVQSNPVLVIVAIC